MFDSDKQNNVVELTDDNWNTEVEEYTGLILVDVWAPWCAPCRIIGPFIDELANEYLGHVKVGKLNADRNGIASQLSVTAIPTILFIRDNRVVDRVVGTVPKRYLVEKLEYHLAGVNAVAV